ncbi:hypothetical protein AND_005382 [Anopheles darlingi]|uniref:Adenylate cyclase n=2 Tax=Anopheles darlingi TaxID=43151 RepID=W5JEY7_ANODA|nr:hypothetical protein AND_005382 [Anopheles darlingi]
MLNGTSFISMRSIASKLVASDELGKVNSLFGVAEALMPLVYAPMYTTVYSATINVLPGAFFLLGGALTSPAVIIFLWMYRVHKREAREIAEEKRAEDKHRQLGESAAVGEGTGDRAITISIGVANAAFENDENGGGGIGSDKLPPASHAAKPTTANGDEPTKL